MTNFLCVRPTAGLSNRLLALVSSIRASITYDCELAIDWTPTDECMAEFRDLFSYPKAKSFNLKSEDFSSKIVALQNTSIKDSWVFIDNPVIPNPANIGNIHITGQTWFSLDSENRLATWLPEDDSLNYFSKHFRLLEFSSQVKEILHKIQFLDLKNSIAIHIRRPFVKGNRFHEIEVSKFEELSDEWYICLIERLLKNNPELKIILSTNGERTEKAIQTKFGRQVYSYEKRSFDNGVSYEAVQDALVDLIILSQAHLIFSNSRSVFGQVASLIGDCKLVRTRDINLMEIMDNDTKQFSFVNVDDDYLPKYLLSLIAPQSSEHN